MEGHSVVLYGPPIYQAIARGDLVTQHGGVAEAKHK